MGIEGYLIVSALLFGIGAFGFMARRNAILMLISIELVIMLGILLFIHPLGFTHAHRMSEYYFNNLIGNPLESTLAIGHLIFGGVLDRYPALRICVAHGGGYIPGYWGRMDHAWRVRADCSEHCRNEPSSYLRKLWLDTLVFDQDQLDSLVPYTVDARDNTGVFIAYDGRIGRQRLQASARNDDNAQFGNHLTGSLGWGMALGNGLRLSANAATGFKAPTFNDLYYPGSESPWLQPETSRSYNLGLSRTVAGHRWSLDVYESRIDDLIVFVYPPPDFVGVGSNIAQARIRGAEFTFDTVLAGFDLSAQLSHTDPRDRSGGANHDRLLARRARTTGRIDLDRDFGPLRAGLSVQGAGARYDDPANTVRLGGHATTDLRLEYALGRDWSLAARASNLFDRQYESVAWYYQPGREYQLSLRWRPAPR